VDKVEVLDPKNKRALVYTTPDNIKVVVEKMARMWS